MSCSCYRKRESCERFLLCRVGIHADDGTDKTVRATGGLDSPVQARGAVSARTGLSVLRLHGQDARATGAL
ncbi:MAG: hypothetical protein NZ874_00145 [Fimbriimonadales bacterium]|nr:hypothetical protein [Fimbriimonadales bacterium]